MRYFRSLKIIVLTAVALMGLGSCAMMSEDLEPCLDGLYVKFTYDYNTQRADLFPYHVGYIRLLVFDEEGNKVTERMVSNSDTDAPLAEHGFTVYFPTSELPAGKYRLQAIGMQKDWEEALATKGAKYRRTDPQTADEHHITLDHYMPSEPFECGHHRVSDEAPLDTLWHTLKVTSTEPLATREDPGVHKTAKPYSPTPHADQLVSVEQNKYTYATVSMMRDTKHLNLTVRQLDNPAECRHSDYEVLIVDDNTHLDSDNLPVEEEIVHYTPYASWTSKFTENGLEVEDAEGSMTKAGSDEEPEVRERIAHYDMMFNRLMYPEENDKSPLLLIRSRKDRKEIARIGLAQVLSDGRMAYEMYNYGVQEYLDREHDYHLDFILKGDQWQYLEIHVLSWSKRTQNVELN